MLAVQSIPSFVLHVTWVRASRTTSSVNVSVHLLTYVWRWASLVLPQAKHHRREFVLRYLPQLLRFPDIYSSTHGWWPQWSNHKPNTTDGNSCFDTYLNCYGFRTSTHLLMDGNLTDLTTSQTHQTGVRSSIPTSIVKVSGHLLMDGDITDLTTSQTRQTGVRASIPTSIVKVSGHLLIYSWMVTSLIWPQAKHHRWEFVLRYLPQLLRFPDIYSSTRGWWHHWSNHKPNTTDGSWCFDAYLNC